MLLNNGRKTMASPKLTTSIRDKIIHNALKNAFAAEKAAIASDKTAFAKMVYDHVIPVEHQEILSKVPVCYLNRGSSVSFRLRAPGASAYTRVNVSMGEERPQSHELFYNNIHIEDAAIDAAWSAIYERERQVENATSELREKISQVVWSVSTVKRLLEVWPEGKEFIPASATATAATLPAVVVTGLNEMLAKALNRPLTA